MPTAIPSSRYPLRCWQRQAKEKVTFLIAAQLEDQPCEEDRELLWLLRRFLMALDQPFLAWTIAQTRSYEQYLAQLGDFLYCPDEEVVDGQEPPAALLDIYEELYRERY